MAFDSSAPPASPSHCPFCRIAAVYPPSSPSVPPSPSSSPSSSSASSSNDSSPLSPAAFVVLQTPLCIAFLDIMPLSPGHLLVCPRRHSEKISDVTAEEARELGGWLRVLSRVLARVTGVGDWNVVQNNGAAAAQVVPHVHYHIIPRPALTDSQRNRSFTMFGRGQRSDLDEDEAAELVYNLRVELANEMGSVKL